MRFQPQSITFLSAATTLAFLTGCAGSGFTAPSANALASTQAQTGRTIVPASILRGAALGALPFGIRVADVRPSHRAPFVSVAGINALHGNQTIIADAATATVTVWGGAGQLNAILFDGIAADPNGLATDSQESLYVANVNFSNVVVYPKPYTSITRTLLDPNEETIDVAVSKTGLVGVTNYLTTSLLPGSVALYAKGSSTACATIQDPKWVTFQDDAFDASGNLFFDGQGSLGQVLVGEISGGCRATSIKTLAVGNTLSSAGGVAVYHGSILIDDYLKQTVYTYAAPSGDSLGSPTATTVLAGATYPVAIAMMEGGQNLWTADFNAGTPLAGKYAYPSGAAVKVIDDHILPIGIAVNPAAKP